MTEPVKPPFIFYPSAWWPKSYAPLGAWVKYTPGPAKVEVLARGSGWVYISTPDRLLLLVRNALTQGAPRPLDGDWDEFVPFSLANTSAQNLPLDRYMVNYFQHIRRAKGGDLASARANYRVSANLRQPGCVVNDRKTILSDSGGFQLLTGKAEWIDPVDLAQWYAANCDEGITLDIPVVHTLEKEFLLRSAHAQVANTRLMQEHLPEDFGLFNVMHGQSVDLARRYREIVERDGPDDRLCVAGVYHGNIMMSVGRLIQHILDPDFKTYKQYHILGVYNVAMLIPIIRFAALMRQKGHDFTISSDASTAVYSAGNRTMHLQRAHWRPAERMMLGRSAPASEPNVYRHLPCSCPVCQTLKYVDIISHVDEAIVAHSFIMHNMIEIERWVKMMVHYAEVFNAAEYQELVESQLAGSPALRSVKPALRFVEVAAASGYDAAASEFSAQMSAGLGYENVTDVNGVGWTAEEEVGDRSALPAHTDDWWKTRIEGILTNYESHHAGQTQTLPEGPREKKTPLKRGVKKVMMNSAVVAAGSQKAPKRRARLVATTKGASSHAKKRLPFSPAEASAKVAAPQSK